MANVIWVWNGGFEFTETASIFIRRLMEMCVRLRSGSGSGGKSQEGYWPGARG